MYVEPGVNFVTGSKISNKFQTIKENKRGRDIKTDPENNPNEPPNKIQFLSHQMDDFHPNSSLVRLFTLVKNFKKSGKYRNFNNLG